MPSNYLRRLNSCSNPSWAPRRSASPRNLRFSLNYLTYFVAIAAQRTADCCDFAYILEGSSPASITMRSRQGRCDTNMGEIVPAAARTVAPPIWQRSSSNARPSSHTLIPSWRRWSRGRWPRRSSKPTRSRPANCFSPRHGGHDISFTPSLTHARLVVTGARLRSGCRRSFRMSAGAYRRT